MSHKYLSQVDFVNSYDKGVREFSNILLQWIDLSGKTFEDVVVKDSKILFCTFRNCAFKNCKFINCEIFFGTWYYGDIKDVLFDKCSIDMTMFDTVRFERTKITNSNLRTTGILASNASDVDTSTSTKFRFVTDISQLSPQEIESIIMESVDIINKFDIGIRMKFMEATRQDLERHKIDDPLKKKKDPYQSSIKEEGKVTYGEMKNFVESSLEAYKQGTDIYKSKKPSYK